jgi:hypothetical protein
VAIGYRAIQNGFETLFTTAAELIEDLSNASKRGHLQESLTTYTHPHVLVIDEVGYLTYGPDAANVLFHVVNDRHLRKRPMIFTTNKPLNEWGKVLHDEDMAAAILDRVLERGRFIHLDGLSGRTRHLNLEETLQENTKRLRISGIGGSEFPEPTAGSDSETELDLQRRQERRTETRQKTGRHRKLIVTQQVNWSQAPKWSYVPHECLERTMGIEPTSEAWEPSDTCGDEKFWCNFGAVKGRKNRAISRKRRQGNGLEFLPSWFVARRSIQLSYGRTVKHFTVNSLR